MLLKRIPKAAKRTFSGLMAVVLAATAMGPLSVLVSANAKSFQYIEQLKKDKTDTGADFSIFELVPDSSESTMGYYVKNSDPIEKYINAVVEQGYDSANRQTAINNIYNDKLSDIIGTTDDYPMTKTTGYKEYVPWAEDRPEGLASLTSAAEEKYTDVPDKFRAPQDDEVANYQSHGVYRLPTEYFNLNSWASNSLTTSEAISGLTLETDKSTYIKFASSDLIPDHHTGYAKTSVGYDNYYGVAVTPGETYSFSFDFTSDYTTTKTNGVDGQFTIYTYGKTKAIRTGSSSYTYTYTKTNDDGTQTVTGPTTVNNTLKRAFIIEAQGVSTGLYDENIGHYEYTFTVPDDVYYLQFSFGTWHQGWGNTGSVTFSDVHLRNVKDVPNVVQELSTLEPATQVAEDGADDYYYAVKFTPITTMEELEASDVVYEQIWNNDGSQYYYSVENADGTISQVPAYQLLFNVDEITDDVEMTEEKLKAGGYGLLSVDESANIVVSETPDAQHFYHAVPVYNNAGDLSFIKPGDDTLGYYSGENSYFITESVNYSFVGADGNYVYDNSINATSTTTVYTQRFYYDKGITCNQWFKYKVLDRYDDDGYDFLTTLTTCSPQDVTDNEDQYLITIKTRDLIVLSAGTQVNYTSFSSDISSSMRKAILECVGSEYNIPVVVDVQILNMVDSNSQLAKLVNALVDRSTDEGVSTKEGGVAQNVYIYNSKDIGSSSMATTKFNTKISKTVSEKSSPYYDVYAEIDNENLYRTIDTYTYEDKELPSSYVSEATCIRCIINYAGRRIKNVKDKVRVLDIEPYVSVDHRTAVITDEVYAYASKKYSNTDCLKALDVISWLPTGTFTDSSGNPITENSKEEEAAKYIDITTMSVAEFVGHNEDLIGNYDLVYFGDSLENFNQANGMNGVKQTHYNDTDMDGLIYSAMGDTYVIGNNGNVVDGDTLLGLNNEDYKYELTLFSKTIRYMVPGATSTVRTTGNDITDSVKEKLEVFTKAGLPVVLANSLTTSAEGTGTDGGKYVYDDDGNAKLQVNFSVSLQTKTQYRDNDESDRYFTYYLATFNGNLPTGVSVVFKWYYVPSGTNLTDGNFNKENVAECISEVTATNIFGKGTGKLEEPVHAVDVTVEENVHNWYSTIGDIDQNFDYKDWNDDTTKDKITGLTIQGTENDSGGQAYQSPGTYFFCEATLVVDKAYQDDPILSAYNNTVWRSDIVQAIKETKTLNINLAYNSDKSTSITVTPNPYYQDSISDNFGFWWKKYSWQKVLWWYEWTDYDDDYVHRIDWEDVWQATLEKTEQSESNGVTTFTKKDIDVNYTNPKGIIIKTVRNANGFTMYGNDDDDGDKLVQTYESVGSRDKDANGNLTNPGYLKMTCYCAHSINYKGDKSSDGAQALSVEMRIKGMGDGIQINTSKPSGFTIDLDKDEQMGDAHYYGRKKDNNAAGNYSWSYSSLSIKHTGLTVTNTPILVSTEYSSISTVAVDNTSKLYQYLSSVYDTVTKEGGGYITRGDGAKLEREPNIFTENQFKYAKDTSEIKKNLYSYLCTIYSPELRIINNSVVLYPQVITDSTVSAEFAIYNDSDTNGSDTYKVEFYVDENHDAKFTDDEAKGFNDLVEINTGSMSTDAGTSVNKNELKSTTSDLSQWHEYRFTRTLSNDTAGLVTWMLKIVNVNESAVYDSYIGCSYIKGERQIIKCLQVLPADWWSSGTKGDTSDSYITTCGQWKRNTKQTDGTYKGGSMESSYKQERANEIEGNAFLGSVFLGEEEVPDSEKTKIIQKNSNGEYEEVYADAFYSLTREDSSSFDRTVYYEKVDESVNKIGYRTHVVFWVRPQGEMTDVIENGEVVYDAKGNIMKEYKNCDFEVDIALTDIYELNNIYSANKDSTFLHDYATQMLILGFGDSYGKCVVQSTWAKLFGLELPGRATLGFNVNAALAIKDYIANKPVHYDDGTEEGKEITPNHSVLFCHDTTNTTNDYLSYFAQSALSKITEKLNELTDKVEKLMKKIKSWFTGKNYPDEDKFTTNVQQSKVKDGYYNNILLRDSLNLDRFGITYSIRGVIGEENISEDMDNNTWADGYKYNGIAYYQNSKTSVDIMRSKNFSIVYKSKSAATAVDGKELKGANGVRYVEYGSNKEPIVDTSRAKEDDTDNKQTVDIDKSAQGFTTWSIVRYGDEGTKNQLLPAGIVESNTDGHTFMTNKVQQVNKGQLTTYPYNINTAEFGGTAGNTDESSNSYGKITIKATHEQVYQVNTNADETTVWYTLAGADEEADESDYRDDYDAISKDVVNSYYIFTSGNITYTGAGHSNIFSEEEAKLFLNTLVASFKVSGEEPKVKFVKASNSGSNASTGADLSYELLAAEKVENENGEEEYTIKNTVAAIWVIDPNNVINDDSTGTSVSFYIKDENDKPVSLDDSIVLYTTKEAAEKGEGTTVPLTAVKSDTTYYFKVPDELLESLKTKYVTVTQKNEDGEEVQVKEKAGETVLYAKVFSEKDGIVYPGNEVSLKFRVLGLYDLG